MSTNGTQLRLVLDHSPNAVAMKVVEAGKVLPLTPIHLCVANCTNFLFFRIISIATTAPAAIARFRRGSLGFT